MTLINQLEKYRRANVELLGSRLAAADVEDTITLKAVGRAKWLCSPPSLEVRWQNVFCRRSCSKTPG
jgi:hypothetical protein